MTDSLTLATWKYLSAQTALTATLGFDVVSATWLFRDHLQATVEGSGAVAVVVRTNGSWATPNQHNTARFPVLACDIWADPQRDGGNNVVQDDTTDKIETTFVALYRLLHLPAADEYLWGDLRVLSSLGSSEPIFYPVIDGDHMRQAMATFNIVLG